MPIRCHTRTLILSCLTACAALAADVTPPQEVVLGTAKATVTEGVIAVATGTMERTWRWTGRGLLTTGLRDTATGRDYAVASQETCDWDLPGVLGPKAVGTLVSVTARVDDDQGFTGKFIEVVATVRYEAEHLDLQQVVWAFPGAPGLRTQLRLKALPGFAPVGDPKVFPKGVSFADRPYVDCGSTRLAPGARVDLLPVDLAMANHRRYWGYYNDPGNRLLASTPMLEEQLVRGWPVFQPEVITWASGVAVEYGDAGIIAVKESAKAVNQPAHLTGAFFTSPVGVAVTGPGLEVKELLPDRFRECWATWSIVYSGGQDGLQKALKQFDAARYPVVPARDMLLLSNTWGPAGPGGMKFAEEKHVLKEIAEGGKLGLDVVQIDDGWQQGGGSSGAKNFKPKYANGWADITAAAKLAGVRLGLWVAIRNADPKDLRQNLDDLGFVTWKADFDHLASRSDYENRTGTYRDVMRHAPGMTQFSLCPEYEAPRYGWYFAREYGSIFFQNVQDAVPQHLAMVPFQVLRQHWWMARYFPANKLQVMLQNPKRLKPAISDAAQHSHAYTFAMGIPFVPCLFQATSFLDPAGKAELTEMIRLYKTCREDVFTSTTYPIGDEPCNAAWTGFQMVSSTRPGGHLLLFRELHNAEATRAVPLKFLAGQTLSVTDVITGAQTTVAVGQDGLAEFHIPKPADFRLLRYEVKR